MDLIDKWLFIMLTIQKIKDVLFHTTQAQNLFIEKANSHNPAIPGDTFDEKLYYLIHSGSEDSLQLLLAPFLRERVYAYLSYGETEEAINQRSAYIFTSGNYLIEQIDNGASEDFDNHLTPSQIREITEDFQQRRNHFIQTRGQVAWDIMLENTNMGQNISPEFLQLKNSFMQNCSLFEQSTANDLATEVAIDGIQLWNRIYNTSAEIQEFYQIKQSFIDTWSEEQWQNCCAIVVDQNYAFHPLTEDTTTEEILDLPSIPTAEEHFIRCKNEYIKKHNQQAWAAARALPPIPAILLNKALELKHQFITHHGWSEWLRIKKPPPHIFAFDRMKEAFVNKWTLEKWHQYLANTHDTALTMAEIATLEDPIAQDFEERKLHFFNKYRNIPNAWELAKDYPSISEDAWNLFKELENEFISLWGKKEWDEYLAKHRRSTEYATDKQLKVLAELFNLRFEVTTINNGQKLTTQRIRDEGEGRPVHLYCQDFIHYFVHEDGYDDTIGNGSCGYNGFAQWLQFLILGTEPRRYIVTTNDNKAASSASKLVQSTLLRTIDNASQVDLDESIEGFLAQEEITIQRLHKELNLDYSFVSATGFAEFLQTKIQDLIRVSRANKLPYNRIPLLEKISKLVGIFGKNNSQAELTTLQDILAHIANTLYLPNSRGVDPNWTDDSFKQNIAHLKALTFAKLPAEKFKDLAKSIQNLNFSDLSPESSFMSMFPRRPNISFSNLTYQSSFQKNIPPPEEHDFLSAALCIAGIFLLITGLTCFTGLLLVGLTSGTASLGLLLMNIGLQSIASTLAAIIGLSAPQTAVIVASSGAVMLSGLGLSLFKDFAPPAMLEHSPIFSMAPF